MILTRLKIERAASWKPNAGQYEGVAEFTGIEWKDQRLPHNAPLCGPREAASQSSGA